MKGMFLLMFSCLVLLTMNAQEVQTEERYSVSGGVLGAANWSKFRVSGDNGVTEPEYDFKTGWAAGAWLNLPAGKMFSVEPQVLYSTYQYFTNSTANLLLNDGRIRYISVPVLLKLHAGDKFAITAGPQVDFVVATKDFNNIATDDDFNKTSLSVFGGLEILPRGRVTIFGRYIHGLSNMDEGGNHVSGFEYKNSAIQVGLKLRLFGGTTSTTYKATDVADSDGDGINDDVDKCPTQFGLAKYNGCPIPDSDGDGINDELDKCPNQAGTAKYEGCPIPDSDGDGINDELDKCPNQAGTAKYEGCPIPDSDGDGVNDELDKCPTQAGPADREGCPVMDKDNDGINDEADKCPDVAGVASNNGCPEVPANVTKSLGISASKIRFGTGSNNATITTGSYASLDQVVALMNEHPTMHIKIEGHTSNVGDEDANEDLSSARAKAVMDYLISKGIAADRIEKEGFGETMPIADNNTAAGRAKNNRIEIKVLY